MIKKDYKATGFVLLLVMCSILFAGGPSSAGERSLQADLFLGSPSAIGLEHNFLSLSAHRQLPAVQSGQPRNAKPFLKSLLIPGWGQYSQNRKGAALAFLGMETILWGGMIGVKTYGNWLEGDYQAYANSHANIDPSGKNHDFYVDIGNYDTRDEYNEIQQLERDWNSLYLGSEYNWEWDSSANRTTFEDVRIKSDLYKNSSIYFAGAIVVNHLAAAIDAARHSRIQESLQAGVSLDPNGNSMLTIIKGL